MGRIEAFFSEVVGNWVDRSGDIGQGIAIRMVVERQNLVGWDCKAKMEVSRYPLVALPCGAVAPCPSDWFLSRDLGRCYGTQRGRSSVQAFPELENEITSWKRPRTKD